MRAAHSLPTEKISDTRTRDVTAVAPAGAHAIRVGKPCASVTPEPRRQTQVHVRLVISPALTLSPDDSLSPSRS
jgi:hypothetical protein